MKQLLALCITIPTLIVADFSQNIHRYMWANYYQFAGKQPEAFACFQRVIQDQPSLFCYKGYIHYLSKIHQLETVLPLIEKLDTPFKDDPDVQLTFALALKSAGKTTDASQRLIGLSQRFKNHIEIAYYTAHAYVEQKEPENAIAVIDELLNHSPQKPNFFIFHYLKTQLYIQIKNYPHALACIQECTALHPEFDQGWYLFGVLQEKIGHLKEAIKGYTTFLSMSIKPNKELEHHVLQLMLKQQDVIKKSSTGETPTDFDKALGLYKDHKYKDALKYINRYTKEHHAHYKGRLLKIQILASLSQTEKAIKALTQWIHETPEQELWYRALHLLTYHGVSLTRAIKVFESLARTYPNQELPDKYLAHVQFKARYRQPTHQACATHTNSTHTKRDQTSVFPVNKQKSPFGPIQL